MRAFWWFKENAIAGMARPGFNLAHWFDLSFDEAVVLGWLGQFSSGPQDVAAFRSHVKLYGAKIAPFYQLDERALARTVGVYSEDVGVLEGLARVAGRTKILESYDLKSGKIHFTFCGARLQEEIAFLKRQNVHAVVSLTEHHHHKDELQNHFSLHHFSIEDLNAPKMEQANQLAALIMASSEKGQTLAVHCLAGIGRTSTMLMAAHLIIGERFDELEALLAKQNPSFKLVGPQADFVRSISKKH